MRNKLSYTAIEKYLTCPKMYFLHYIRGIREKYVGSALPFGNAFDEALNVLLTSTTSQYIKDAHKIFEQKMLTQKLNGKETDLSSTSFLNYSNEDFDWDILTKEDIQDIVKVTTIQDIDLKSAHETMLSLKKERKLKGEALKDFNYMSFVSLKRKGHLFLDAYVEQILPKIKRVIVVQKEFSIKNEEGDEFSGKIDLIAELLDGHYVIFDNKSSASPYKDDSAQDSKQLASYYGVLFELGFFDEYKIPLDNLFIGFITVVKKIRKKKEPRVQIQFIINPVNEALVEEVFAEYDLVNEKIHNGEFPANPENCKAKNFGKCFCNLNSNQIVDISLDWGKKK